MQKMADNGLANQADADDMLNDWIEHFENPDSVFFSPPVLKVAGRKV